MHPNYGNAYRRLSCSVVVAVTCSWSGASAGARRQSALAAGGSVGLDALLGELAAARRRHDLSLSPDGWERVVIHASGRPPPLWPPYSLPLCRRRPHPTYPSLSLLGGGRPPPLPVPGGRPPPPPPQATPASPTARLDPWLPTRSQARAPLTCPLPSMSESRRPESERGGWACFSTGDVVWPVKASMSVKAEAALTPQPHRVPLTGEVGRGCLAGRGGTRPQAGAGLRGGPQRGAPDDATDSPRVPGHDPHSHREARPHLSLGALDGQEALSHVGWVLGVV